MAIGKMIGIFFKIKPRHIFIGFHQTASGRLQIIQDRQCRIKRRHSQHRRGIGTWFRHQAQHSGGDNTQSAFSPDHQMFQIIARVVFVQLGHHLHDLAVGQHHFDPKAEITGIAIAQHIRAPRIGRQHTADHR